MRRLSILIAVMALVIGVAPTATATEAEVCFPISGHNFLEGSVETGEFAGTTFVKFPGFPLAEGTLEGMFLNETQATGTYTFGEEGSFTDITDNLIQPKKDGTFQFRFTGEIIGGTGEGEGATGNTAGRGVVHVNDDGVTYTVQAKWGGTMCLPNGDEV